MAQLRDKMLIKGETIDAQSLRYGLFQLGLDLSDFDIQLILTVPLNHIQYSLNQGA